eukprot:TRINITY_DN2248_c0_g1_i1.p1 TRINITY_DN2248_c0_g1~~TRINITY_DN2248_c0_g1_i1.p1  ORF type:complete len:315 (+),score=25.08 TRINITY_DN2248_c0_g1_i1:209-1153(+)
MRRYHQHSSRYSGYSGTYRTTLDSARAPASRTRADFDPSANIRRNAYGLDSTAGRSLYSSAYRTSLDSARAPTSRARAETISLKASTGVSHHSKGPCRTGTMMAHLAPIPDKASNGGTHPKGTCDKCDGPHLTDNCPIFKKPREDHPDATRRKNHKDIGGDGGDGPGRYLSSARVISQPGDGSCLFHSLAYGYGSGSARSLRREIADYIRAHQDLEIAGDALRDWVKWDSGTSVSAYCSRMAVSGWGGGIEMAAFSRMKRLNVHVYERCGGRVGASFKRVSAFDVPNASKTVRGVSISTRCRCKTCNSHPHQLF